MGHQLRGTYFNPLSVATFAGKVFEEVDKCAVYLVPTRKGGSGIIAIAVVMMMQNSISLTYFIT